MRIGWIGLGRIGLPMALRLVQKGHEVLAWDLDPEALGRATAAGAREATSAGEILCEADVLFLCVTDSRAIEQILFGANGIPGGRRQMLIVDHTTIDPETCRAIASRAAKELGIRWIDCPISGGVEGAEKGELIAWLGGKPKDIEQVRHLVDSYASKLTFMGAVGQGQLAKSCNQFVVAATIATWSQMLRYAKKLGIDPVKLVQSMEGGATASRIEKAFARSLAQGDFPALSSRNMQKDLAIIVHQGNSSGGQVPLAQAALKEFADHLDMPRDR